MSIPRAVIAALLVMVALLPAHAAGEGGYRSVSKHAKFADVRQDLEDAILKRGFVIDHVGQVKDMLDRTAGIAGDTAAGGAKAVYREAQYLQFCPAKLTHEATVLSPLAIANCPVTVFVFELAKEAGTVHVGYRIPVANGASGMADINARLTALLDEIVGEAAK